MIQAMYNGVSGLRAHQTQLDVISNNIANINTVGYKASRVSFKEMLSQTVNGATAPQEGGIGGTNASQIGLGVNVGSIDVNLAQGSMQLTGKPTDIAIEGNGFLVLGDGQGSFFTRDGSFALDAEGNLVSASTGLKVLGWSADFSTGALDSSQPVSASSSIKIPIGELGIARQSTQISYGGNLNLSTAVGGQETISCQVYDSLGSPHTMMVTFTKTDVPGEWTWEASSPDAAAGSPLGSGTIEFDSSGGCLTSSGNISLVLETPNGSQNPINVALSFANLTQLDGNTNASITYQNGLSFGTLDGFTIGSDGIISGIFTNGMSQTIGQIALAKFSNPSGLTKAGNNLLSQTGNSGMPQIGEPSVGGLGNLSSGFLEASNVDLPTEFADMIVAQRGFQANSRIITTSDEILQELVMLKR